MQQTENLNVLAVEVMPSPDEIKARVPLTERAVATVLTGRRTLEAVLDGRDRRLFVVVGPCSIHDPVAGLDYARRLRALADEVADTLVLVMRVYFEKPRTSLGWKGFINDPRMDDSFRIDEGMERARRFLLDVDELGLPAGTEALDPIAPQYYWATSSPGRPSAPAPPSRRRTARCPPACPRRSASRTPPTATCKRRSTPIVSAGQPHAFLGINFGGRSAIVRTRGNRYGHLVLRGGGGRPNFDTVSICAGGGGAGPGAAAAQPGHRLLARQLLEEAGAAAAGHARRGAPDPRGQPLGGGAHGGELHRGRATSPSPQDLSKLRYGCSVTDPCVSWDTTVEMIRSARDELRPVLANRNRLP